MDTASSSSLGFGGAVGEDTWLGLHGGCFSNPRFRFGIAFEVRKVLQNDSKNRLVHVFFVTLK